MYRRDYKETDFMSDTKRTMTYGLMSYELYRAYQSRGIDIRVFYGCVDVTNRCRAANDEEGWVILFRLNDAGNPYFLYDAEKPYFRHRLAVEKLYGNVEFRSVDNGPKGTTKEDDSGK